MEHLATPQLRYIGLQPRDIERLRLPDECRLPLTQRDRSLIDSLSARPFVIQQPLLRQQVVIPLFSLSVKESFAFIFFLWGFFFTLFSHYFLVSFAAANFTSNGLQSGDSRWTFVVIFFLRKSPIPSLLGLTRLHPQYLSRTYLPAKIQSRSWI